MYKKGDIVRIKKHIIITSSNTEINLVGSMLRYAGKTARITSVSKYKSCLGYKLDIDNSLWNWSAEMFESVKPKLFKLL